MTRALLAIFVAAAGMTPLVANAQAIETHQSASSHIDADGIRQAEQSVSVSNSFASSQAIWPGGVLPPAQARTAARSRETEIAANARVFATTFAPRPFDLALSQAVYTIEVEPLLLSTHAELDFHLPPSYVEIVGNAEFPVNVMNAVFLADLRVCQSPTCGISDQRFSMQVNGEGSFRDMHHSISVDGDPTLDFTALQNPTVSDTVDGLLRTYLVEFPAYTGHVSFDLDPSGNPLRLEYTLQARAWGVATFNSAIAAINDPFLLDTDPVQQGTPLTLALTPVPEPSTLMLALAGLPLAAAWRRRRHAALTANARP